jgi:K(+)-stimulated pyrophosphate-energized sodium pump
VELTAAVVIGCGAAAVAFSVWTIRAVLSAPAGESAMLRIADAIRVGATAYLERQYRAVAIVGAAVAIATGWLLGIHVAIGFLIGATLSAATGYIGMGVAVRANVRTAEAARRGLVPALRVSVRSGTVTGLLVVGLGLLGVSGYYLVLQQVFDEPQKIVDGLLGLSFGGSLISIFARLGGGIFTKGADVGADLVGKIEAGIPEDDPRNPAVIADAVGDNVGDCAGMAADVFETYAVTLVATMLLASLSFAGALQERMMWLPLLVNGVCIIGAIAGTLSVQAMTGQSIMRMFFQGVLVTIAVSLVLVTLALDRLIGLARDLSVGTTSFHGWNLVVCAAVGFAVTGLLMWITEYYTGTAHRPVRSVAAASTGGPATNVIGGLAVSMEATGAPVLVICVAILVAFFNAGLFGIAVAASAMLGLAGMVVTIDAYGPVTDNAGGIAEMADLPPAVREVTDALDAVGNTTKAVTKAYAIGSAGLAALVLFASYTEDLRRLLPSVDVGFALQDPYVLVGLLLGGLLPYLFASRAMTAVSHASGAIIADTRQQLRETPEIMTGEAEPDYGRAVSMLTGAAIREMVVPSLLPVLAPIAVYVAIDATEGQAHALATLGAMLLGTIVTGLFLAISMTSGGAAWDNAKKYIEGGHFGGPESAARVAAVTGDTVGDPYKDTAGPAINPMIKIVNIVALLLLAVVAR